MSYYRFYGFILLSFEKELSYANISFWLSIVNSIHYFNMAFCLPQISFKSLIPKHSWKVFFIIAMNSLSSLFKVLFLPISSSNFTHSVSNLLIRSMCYLYFSYLSSNFDLRRVFYCYSLLMWSCNWRCSIDKWEELWTPSGFSVWKCLDSRFDA